MKMLWVINCLPCASTPVGLNPLDFLSQNTTFMALRYCNIKQSSVLLPAIE